jgi:hypothetical protein
MSLFLYGDVMYETITKTPSISILGMGGSEVTTTVYAKRDYLDKLLRPKDGIIEDILCIIV